MSDLTTVVRYGIWANATWIRFIGEHCPTDEELLRLTSHVLLGERAWFRRIAGEEPEREIWRVMTVPNLLEMHEAHRAIYLALLEGDLARVIAYTRFTGEEYRSPVSDILLHLSLHGAHHRGQMATAASARGLTPVKADFIQYCVTHGIRAVIGDRDRDRQNAGS